MPLVDSFQRTVNTNISTGTADNGSTWSFRVRDGTSNSTGSDPTVTIRISPVGRARQGSKVVAATTLVYNNNTAPGSANYEVAAVFTWYGDSDLVSGDVNRIAFGLRYASNIGYAATINFNPSTGGQKTFFIQDLQQVATSSTSSKFRQWPGSSSSALNLTIGHSYAVFIKAGSASVDAGIMNLTTGLWLNSSTGQFDIDSSAIVNAASVNNPTVTQTGLLALLGRFVVNTNPSDTTGFSIAQVHLAANNVWSEIPKLSLSPNNNFGFSGVTSSNFTVSYSGIIPSGKTITVTPTDNGVNGVFSPSSFTINSTNTTRTFTYTPPVLPLESFPQEIKISVVGENIQQASVNYTSFSTNGNVSEVITPNPLAQYVGYNSTEFRVRFTGINGATTVYLSDNSNGVFTPNVLNFTGNGDEKSFIYRPNSLGNITLSLTGTNFSTKTYNFVGLTPTVVIKESPNLAWVGNASKTFTVGLNGGVTELAGSIPLTLSATGGGTFTPLSVTITGANPTATFTYTPTSTGSKTITVSSVLTLPGSKTIKVGTKPNALTLTSPIKNTGEIGLFTDAFNVSINGLVIDPVEVTISDNDKNSIIPKIIFSNLEQIDNPVQSKDFKIKVCNTEALIFTASSPGLASDTATYTATLDTKNYERSLVFSDNFERVNSNSLDNGWLHGIQYSINNGQVLTTKETLPDVLTFFKGQVVRTTVRCFLDKESFVLTSAELNAFHKVQVGDNVLGNNQIAANTLIVTKNSNNSLVLSKKPLDSSPMDCLRNISILNSEIESLIFPPYTFSYNQLQSARLISRKQANKNAKYFVDISAENFNSKMRVTASLYVKLSIRERPDRIYSRKVVLTNIAHIFRFTTISYESATTLELRAINPTTGIETFIFKIVNGEPELQNPGDIGLTHNGIVRFDDFKYYQLTLTKKKNPLTYYVDSVNGNDNNTGTSLLPLQSISKALSKYQKGRNLTIIIRPGNYSASSTDESPLILYDGCSLIGETDAPKIFGSILIDQSSDASLNNLIFDGNNYIFKKAVTVRDTFNFIFKNIEITKYRENALDIQRVVNAELSDFKMIDCCYSSLVTGKIPDFSVDKQTSAILFGFLYQTIIRDFFIDTMNYRGGQAMQSWSENWERFYF